MREPNPSAAGGDVVGDAVAAYSAYLSAAYGFASEEVAVPEAYEGREVDWFADFNYVLDELDEYGEREVAAILRRPDARLGEGQSLLSSLRAGQFRRVHRLVRRM